MTSTTARQGSPETVLSLALLSLRNILTVPAAVSDDGIKKVAGIILKANPAPHPSIAPLLKLIALLEYEEKVADAILSDQHVEELAAARLRLIVGGQE